MKNFEYRIVNEEVTITKYTGSNTEVVIPSEIEGMPVTTIGEYAFTCCKGLTSITIPDSITTIGDSAFDWCTGLTSVTIGNNVTTIGDSAFANCTGMKSVTIPESVTSIGEKAFGYYYNDDNNGSVEIDGFTIYGYKGTESKRYAQVNGFKFVDVSDISTTEKKILNKRKELE